MTVSEDDVRALMTQFCGELDVARIENGAFVLSTPFYYGDGDGFLIELEPVETGWRLTDHGDASSHLYFDDVDLTPGQLEFVRRTAERDGITVSPEFALTSETFDALPTADDLATFIQAMARVSAVVALERHPQERYITALRDPIDGWLDQAGIRGVHRWHDPEQDPLGGYRSDLYVPGSASVAMFFVATHDKADRSALTLETYRRWGLTFQPVVAFRQETVSPLYVEKLLNAVDRKDLVVPVPIDNAEALRPTLVETGLPV